MHDCKATKDDLIEIAVSDARLPGDASTRLPECRPCREELNSLRHTMEMTRAGMQLAEPGERFWSGYDERLRERLSCEAQRTYSPATHNRSFPAMLRALMTVSVPVPAPLALVIFGFLVFATGFMFHSRRSSGAPPAAPTAVIEKTVEVPVVHEKVITRVVYRDRESAPRLLFAGSTGSHRNLSEKPREETICLAESLEGFRPAHDARLTIIKGSYRDDK